MSSLPGQWLRAATVNSYTEPAARAYPDLWDVPGGHLELDESELQALTREMHEELGVRIAAESAVRLGRLRSGDGEGAVHVSSWLIGEWEGGPVNIATAEHDEIRWVRMEDLTSLPLAHEGFVGIAWLFVWPGTHVRPSRRPALQQVRPGRGRHRQIDIAGRFSSAACPDCGTANDARQYGSGTTSERGPVVPRGLVLRRSVRPRWTTEVSARREPWGDQSPKTLLVVLVVGEQPGGLRHECCGHRCGASR